MRLFNRPVILLLASGVLIAAGFLVWLRMNLAGEIEVQAEVIIEAPVPHVWQQLTSDQARPFWMRWLVSIYPLTGVEGARGSERLLIYRRDGYDHEIDEFVRAVSPQTRVTYIQETNESWAEITYSLASSDAGTQIQVNAQRHFKKWWQPWLAVFTRDLELEVRQGNLQALKQLSERLWRQRQADELAEALRPQ